MSRDPDRGAVRHVYRVSKWRLAALPLFWLFVVALMLVPPIVGPAPAGEELRSLLVAAGIVGLLMLPGAALVWHSRLVLTPLGIAHYQFGYTVRSTWANVVGISLAPHAEALLLREPGTHSAILRGSAAFLVAVMPGVAQSLAADPKALGEGRMIVLGPFMAHWRRGTLRDDIERWAPHAFGAGAQGEAVQRAD